MNITHAECGGTVTPDVSSILYLRAPSARITLSGIELGTLELAEYTGEAEMRFICLRCGAKISEDSLKSLTMECQVCRNSLPLSSLNTCDGFSCICTDCIAQLKKGTSTSTTSAHMKKLLNWIKLPTTFKVRELLEVLKIINI